MARIELLEPLILTTARILRAHLRDIRDTATGVDQGTLNMDIADLSGALEPFEGTAGPQVNEKGPSQPTEGACKTCDGSGWAGVVSRNPPKFTECPDCGNPQGKPVPIGF